jgi:murein DD-endopeptidase MepM/ murein hydrolase activator NlpD
MIQLGVLSVLIVLLLFPISRIHAFSPLNYKGRTFESNKVPFLLANPDSTEEDEGDGEHDLFSSESPDDPIDNLSFYDSLTRTFEYQFVYHKKHYHKPKYITSRFSNRKIDLYHVKMSEIHDTFHIVLHDPFNGEHVICPYKGQVTSRFGPRRMFNSSFHYGVDLRLRVGDTIRAAKDGIVRIARNDKKGYGNFVVLTHKGGLESLYGHLNKQLVAEGQLVKAGQPIGLGGNTGRSTGPHLHLEFRILGDAFDPMKLFSFPDGRVLSNEVFIDRTWFAYQNPDLLAQTQRKSLAPTGATAGIHVVKSGDTLSHIATRYNTSIEALCRINGFSRSTVLQVGTKVRVM